jgi:molybdopterin biosynthesis enzyme MoaB
MKLGLHVLFQDHILVHVVPISDQNMGPKKNDQAGPILYTSIRQPGLEKKEEKQKHC